MKFYIDVLSKAIQTIVNPHRQTVPHRERAFQDLAHFARYEEEAVRARARQSRQYNRPFTTIAQPRGG